MRSVSFKTPASGGPGRAGFLNRVRIERAVGHAAYGRCEVEGGFRAPAAFPISKHASPQRGRQGVEGAACFAPNPGVKVPELLLVTSCDGALFFKKAGGGASVDEAGLFKERQRAVQTDGAPLSGRVPARGGDELVFGATSETHGIFLKPGNVRVYGSERPKTESAKAVMAKPIAM